MVAWIRAWLFGSSRSQPSPTPQERRLAAQQAYEDAVERRDTREQSTTWQALFEATNTELGR